jgi:hypothetical protein
MNRLNKYSRTADKGDPSIWKLGEGLKALHRENVFLL